MNAQMYHEKTIKCSGKKEMFNEEGWLVMEHIHVLPFGPFEWQNDIQENRANIHVLTKEDNMTRVAQTLVM